MLTAVKILSAGDVLYTQGLSAHGQAELRVKVPDPADAGGYQEVLQYIIDYLSAYNARITEGQTLKLGYWVLRFEGSADGVLDLWEYDEQCESFQPGIGVAFRYWCGQLDVCDQVQAPFDPPAADRLVAVSDGVLDGVRPLEGVRYSPSEHMSGWLLTTDLYDGDINSMKLLHAYHVTAARPELARYFGLPPGFRFALDDQEHVWFDEKVAAEAREQR